MIFTYGDAPILAATSDTHVVAGDGSECKTERGGVQWMYTLHNCEDHYALVIWPTQVFIGICNCGPLREPHGWSVDCSDGHLIQQTQIGGG